MQVQSVARIRPLSLSSARSTVPIKGSFGQFEVDAVFDEGCSQEDVFTGGFLSAVNSFIQGIDAIVLCYGASGSGKSFTLHGPQGVGADGSDGLVQHAVLALLRNLAAVPKHRYTLSASYCGLSAAVDATLVDLLDGGAHLSSVKDAAAASMFDRLTQAPLELPEDIYRVLDTGSAARTAITADAACERGGNSGGIGGSSKHRPSMHALHSMLAITLSGQSSTGAAVRTRLCFVELASPESKDSLGRPASSSSASDAAAQRSLNLGLSSLTAVMAVLRAQDAAAASSSGKPGAPASSPPTLVPWRDSPLTRWLREPLGCAGHAVMIGCCAPGPECAADTLGTLAFVARARTGGRGTGVVVSATWDAAVGQISPAGGHHHGGGAGAGTVAGGHSSRSGNALPPPTFRITSAPGRRNNGSGNGSGGAATAGASPPRLLHTASAANVALLSLTPPTSARDAFAPPSTATAAAAVRATAAAAVARMLGGGDHDGGARHSTTRVSARVSPSESAAPAATSRLLADYARATSLAAYASAGAAVTPGTGGSGASGGSVSLAGELHRRSESPPVSPMHPPEVLSSLEATAGRYGSPPRSSTSGYGGGAARGASGAPRAPKQQQQQQQQWDGSRAATPVSVTPTLQHRAAYTPASVPTPGPTPRSTTPQRSTQHSSQQQQQQRGVPPSSVGAPTPRSLIDSYAANDDDLGAYLTVLKAVKKAPGGGDVGAESSLEALLQGLRDARSDLLLERDRTSKLQDALSSAETRAAAAVARGGGACGGGSPHRGGTPHRDGGLGADWAGERADLGARLAGCQAEVQGLRAALDDAALQLTDSARGQAAATAERDALKAQVSEMAGRLHAEVRTLSGDTATLKARAVEAADRADKEAARAAASDTAAAAARADLSRARAAEGEASAKAQAAQAQVAHMAAQLEGARGERNKLQDVVWTREEDAKGLSAEIQRLTGAVAAAETEARLQASRAEEAAIAGSGADAAARSDLAIVSVQLADERERVAKLVSTCEEQRRAESSSTRDVRDVEVMLREFDRDLEVHANALWRQVRSERADALLAASPEIGGTVGLGARWRPVLKAVLSAVRRQGEALATETERMQELTQRLAASKASAAKSNELASALSESRSTLAAASQREASLSGQLSEQMALASELREAYGGAQNEIEALSERSEALASDRDALADQAAEATADAREARRRCNALATALGERDAALGAAWGEAAELSDGLFVVLAITTAAERDRDERRGGGSFDGFGNDGSKDGMSPAVGAAARGERAPPAPSDWADARASERLAAMLRGCRPGAAAAASAAQQARALRAQLAGMRDELTRVGAEGAAAAQRAEQLSSHLSSAREGASRAASAEAALSEAAAEVEWLRRRLAELEADLHATVASRDSWKVAAAGAEAKLAEHACAADGAAAARDDASRDASDARRAAADVTARVAAAEADATDVRGQLGALKSRLGAAERTASESNARAIELNSKLALAETDARLKVQELSTKLAAADAALLRASTSVRETDESRHRSDSRTESEMVRLRAEVVRLEGERAGALDQADGAGRREAEARARAVDADYMAQQLRGLSEERDEMQAQLRAAVRARESAVDDAATARSSLAVAQQQLRDASSERSLLLARAEASKLDGAVASALASQRRASGGGGSSSLAGGSSVRGGGGGGGGGILVYPTLPGGISGGGGGSFGGGSSSSLLSPGGGGGGSMAGGGYGAGSRGSYIVGSGSTPVREQRSLSVESSSLASTVNKGQPGARGAAAAAAAAAADVARAAAQLPPMPGLSAGGDGPSHSYHNHSNTRADAAQAPPWGSGHGGGGGHARAYVYAGAAGATTHGYSQLYSSPASPMLAAPYSQPHGHSSSSVYAASPTHSTATPGAHRYSYGPPGHGGTVGAQQQQQGSHDYGLGGAAAGVLQQDSVRAYAPAVGPGTAGAQQRGTQDYGAGGSAGLLQHGSAHAHKYAPAGVQQHGAHDHGLSDAAAGVRHQGGPTTHAYDPTGGTGTVHEYGPGSAASRLQQRAATTHAYAPTGGPGAGAGTVASSVRYSSSSVASAYSASVGGSSSYHGHGAAAATFGFASGFAASSPSRSLGGAAAPAHGAALMHAPRVHAAAMMPSPPGGVGGGASGGGDPMSARPGSGSAASLLGGLDPQVHAHAFVSPALGLGPALRVPVVGTPAVASAGALELLGLVAGSSGGGGREASRASDPEHLDVMHTPL
ncbi:hypothetical protein FOA52_009688 [Chlamydomonas sp. UWO 241]|nr:hypothetical protein FOA52_009688 [Chlamydomonas sp. UWO 241]